MEKFPQISDENIKNKTNNPPHKIMKEFLKVLANYVLPYKKYLVGSLLFNLLSAILNVFSFMSIIPMLQMLFGIEKTQYHFIPWDTAGESLKNILDRKSVV